MLRVVHSLIGAPRGLTVGLQWEIEDDVRCHLQAVVLLTGGQQYRGRKTRKQYSMFSISSFSPSPRMEKCLERPVPHVPPFGATTDEAIIDPLVERDAVLLSCIYCREMSAPSFGGWVCFR